MRVGECVMVLMPSEVQGKDWKLATPFHDPYYVIQVTPTNAEVRLIDQCRGESIFVALDCVRWCYPHQGDENMDRIKEKEKASLKQCTYSENQSSTAAISRTSHSFKEPRTGSPLTC